VENSVVRDVCEIMCVSHDLALAERLEKMLKDRDDLDEVVQDYYIHCPLEPGSTKLSFSKKLFHALDRLVIIMSHPHGCSKQISVGYIDIDHTPKTGRKISLHYTTATCRGCRGAPFFALLSGGLFFWFYNFVLCV
jgi:hypothetical protein